MQKNSMDKDWMDQVGQYDRSEIGVKIIDEYFLKVRGNLKKKPVTLKTLPK